MTTFMRFLAPPLARRQSGLEIYYPPFIAGMWMPIHGGDAGINKETYDRSNELLCVIDPYTDMKVGDRLAVYWGEGVLVGEKEIRTPEELDQRVLIFLDKAPVKDGWVERVYYTLFRSGSSIGEDSNALRILVKLKLPAGLDTNPSDDWHSELKMPKLPQDVIDNGVTSEWAARGIPLEIANYPERAPYDNILLRWGSVMIARLVSPEEAAGTDPVTLWVEQAHILAAGDSDALRIRFHIQDDVGNLSSHWSQETTVLVDAGAWRLPAPVIVDAQDGVIDLAVLGNADLRIKILLEDDNFQPGDTVTMTWLGIPGNGSPLVNEQSFVISRVPETRELRIPNHQIKAIGGGTGEASYVLKKANGQLPLSSKRTSAHVTGESSLLPAPDVRERVGDSLDSQLTSAQVLIPPYDGQAEGDWIHMVWAGKTVDGSPYLHEDSHSVTRNEVGTVIGIPVGQEHIEPLKNGMLDLFYEVFNDNFRLFGKTISFNRLLNIRAIQATLPAPEVLEAPNGTLDPDVITGNATLLVNYSGTEKGDTLTYYWQGGPGDGSTSDDIPITHYSAGKPLSFSIPRKHIVPNINDIVRIRYVVKEGKTGMYRYSEVLQLAIGDLLGELPAPTIVEASSADVLDPVNAIDGATVVVRYASMEAAHTIHLNWLGVPGAGTSTDLHLPGSASGSVSFAVPPAVIGANINRTVMINYDVAHKSFRLPSTTLLLRISAFQDPEKQLPKPLISEANNTSNVLNLATFTGNATATVAKWLFIAAKQRIWLRAEGSTAEGAPYLIPLLDSHELSEAETNTGLSRTINRAELEKLGHNTTLTLICKVGFGAEPEEHYALEFPLTRYTFKVRHDWEVPQIERVTDAAGVVAEGGTTLNRTVTVSGTGTGGSSLRLDDGTTPIANNVPIDNQGGWSTVLSNLLVKSYRLTAHGLDGSGYVSPPRTFTVSAANAPTITSVKDSWGEIPHAGFTANTQVTLSGQANANQKVRIIGGPVVNLEVSVGSNGVWSTTLSALDRKAYSITVQALYGDNLPVSSPRDFTVTAVVNPSITSVRDARGELANGGVTTDSSVALTGKASNNLKVQILGGAQPNEVTANASGDWALTLSGLTPRAYSVSARAQYGVNVPDSAARTFTVQSPLQFDESHVTLSGEAYILVGSGLLPNFGFGTSIQRVASGGTQRYSYTSSNSAVAAVDSNSGFVSVRRNGSAVITVTDGSQSKRYTVSVTGVHLCHNLGSGHYQDTVRRANAQGLSIPNLGTLRAISSAYSGRWPWGGSTVYTWSNEVKYPFPPVFVWCLTMSNGQQSAHFDLNIISHTTGIGMGR